MSILTYTLQYTTAHD